MRDLQRIKRYSTTAKDIRKDPLPIQRQCLTIKVYRWEQRFGGSNPHAETTKINALAVFDNIGVFHCEFDVTFVELLCQLIHYS